MTKRKNKIKVKVSNNTTNTLIKVAGLGIVSYLAFKMLSNNENGLAYLGGSSSGYTGSGTDLSSIPAGFFTETPPVFNITNTPPDSFFSTPSLSGSETKKDVSVATLNKTAGTLDGGTLDVNWSSTGANWITDNPISNFFNSMKPSNWGQDLSKDQYTKMTNDYSSLSIFKNENVKNSAKSLGGFLANAVIPFPLNLLVNAPAVAGGCSSGNCPRTNDTTLAIDLSSKKSITSYQSDNFDNAQSFLTAMRQNIQSPTITYTKKAMTPMEYGDFFNKNLAQLEREAQNKMATSLASGNCSPAIATNQCSGTKKSVNYATAVAQTSERRYYENYGTPMTRSDLVYS